jgi:hypothetical protein
VIATKLANQNLNNNKSSCLEGSWISINADTGFDAGFSKDY